MRSLFLVGFPRCGAGVLARGLRPAGYDLGPEPAPWGPGSAADAAAPAALVTLDEAILARAGAPAALRRGWRWCAGLEPDAKLTATPSERQALARLLAPAPFCLWDARLAWTLPELRPLARGAGAVCLFREPREQVAALREAARVDPLLRGAILDERALLAEWTRTYRRVLEHLSVEGEWLFLHREQLLRTCGQSRLAGFAGASFDPTRLRVELLRTVPTDGPEGEAGEVYAELCARAGHAPRGAAAPHAGPDPQPEVVAVVPIREGQQERARQTLDSLLAQRSVACEVLAIDQTLAGEFAHGGVRVLRERSPARGRAYAAALAASEAPWVAWAEPGSLASPARLARCLRAARGRDDIDLLTCDLHVTQGGGLPSRRSTPQGTVPPGGWCSGVLVRRAALAAIDARAFVPAELELLRSAHARGRVLHVAEALVTLDARLQAELDERTRVDDALLELYAREPLPCPQISVLLACHDRQDVIVQCLEGFARQLVPPGTLEIVVVDDGSRDASPALVEALELAVPLRLVRQANAGAAAARNNGLAHLAGRYALLVNDDTVPFPGTVAAHLAALGELDDPRACVLGTFEQPPAELDNALVRMLERTTYVFGYPQHAPGAVVGGAHFYTCNVSLPTAALRELGGFDPSFPCYAEDTEFGLRLERAGYRIHYRPEARARHHHVPRFEGLRWRQQAVARAHARLFAKHPRHTFGALAGLSRAAVARVERQVGPFVGEIEAAARTLAEVDLAALERVGGSLAAAARGIEHSLETIFARLNDYWWRLGSDRGLAELRVSGFPELLARRPLELEPPLRGFALLRADVAGEWLATLDAWLERTANAARPSLLVAAQGADDGELRRVARALALRVAREAHRRRELGVHLTLAADEGVFARLLGSAATWLANPSDGEGLASAARGTDVETWMPDGAAASAPTHGPLLCARVAAETEPAFGELFECCAPLLGRADARLVLLHPADGAGRAGLVANVLRAALAGADGAPEIVTANCEGEGAARTLSAFDARVDPGAALGVDPAGPRTLRGRADLEAWLEELDAFAERLPFVLQREPQHA